MTGEPAPAWDSGNSTVWEKYIDIAFVVANGLILLITSVVGIVANIFVILAVYRQKSLQTSNNALVVNLAVVDFLRCVIDCPILLTIVMTVYQRGDADSFICDTQMAFFSFSCCIQLLTLACISAERYQAIAQPFKASQRKRRIMVLIPLTWTLAVLVAAVCLIFLIDSPVHVRCRGGQRQTSSSYDNFGLYMLFPLWAACFSVIIGFYTGIFALVRSHNRKIFDKGNFPLPKKDTTEKQTTEPAMGVENGKPEQNLTLSTRVAQTPAEPNESNRNPSASLLTSAQAPQNVSISLENQKDFKNTQVISDLEINQPHPCADQTEVKPFKNPEHSNAEPAADAESSDTNVTKVSSHLNTEQQQSKENTTSEKATEERACVLLPTQSENPESTAALLTDPQQSKDSSAGEAQAVAVEVDSVPSLAPASRTAPETEAIQQTAPVEGAVCMMPSKASRERASKKKESKMAKRAGYIIITFLLFWLPLITTIMLNFVQQKRKNTQITIIHNVEILSVSVACITSLSDPIIYAAVNPQFRTEFYRLKNRVKSIFAKKI
ncbi:dopamine D2-like receptor [Parambassis ranga]|uniref:Dopamine D2-like receptor n=1 Tax=Parambassis ranga TaxID=210632 RepID=A0A6P7KD94_9TELE|nr:dopamine D2-like receptor [Parambassis ranga]